MSVDPSSRGWNEHRHRWDVPAGTIRTADLADGSVTAAKLSLGAVSNVLLDAITTSDLLNGTVVAAGITSLGARVVSATPRYSTSQIAIVVTTAVLLSFGSLQEASLLLYIDDGGQKFVLSAGRAADLALTGGVLLLSGLPQTGHAIQTYLNLSGASTSSFCRPGTQPLFEGHRIKVLELTA